MTITKTESRSATIRWLILLTISNACPDGTIESVLLPVIESQYPDTNIDEIRSSLHNLTENGLILLDQRISGGWFCTMRHYGMRFVNYATDAVPGIARPIKSQAQES